MNKTEFVTSVAKKASITPAEAARAVEAVFDAQSGAISKAVDEHGALSIPGFGKFTKGRRVAGSAPVEKQSIVFTPWGGDEPRIRTGEVVKVGTFRHSSRAAEGKTSTRGAARPGVEAAGITFDDSAAFVAQLGRSAEERAIRDLAVEVWESVEDADEFLTTPHVLLGGQAPLSAASTPEGAERVRRILLALEYGLPV